MQFTPQQLVGAGRYAPKTHVGNWNEDRMLEEARMKEFALRKGQGSLLVTHTLKMAFLNEKAPRSLDSEGLIRFNHVVALHHIESDTVLACNTFEETPSIGSNEYLVTAMSSTACLSRNSFRLISPQTWKVAIACGNFSLDAPSEPLHYDEPYLIMCNESLLVDDKSIFLKSPLFLMSGLKTDRSMSPITYKQRVWLSADADSGALWSCARADLAGTDKYLAGGQQIMSGDRITVVHKMTGQALLTSSGSKQRTDFGIELEVSAYSAREAGKRHHLAAEIEGTRTPDNEGNRNMASNIWTFELAKSTDEARDERKLPRFANLSSVIDVLHSCLGADHLYAFRELIVAFTRINTKGTGHLDHEVAKWVIRQQIKNLPLRDEHLSLLFDHFDKQKTGYFPLTDLLQALRAPVIGNRKVLISATFDRLQQKAPDKRLTLASICAAYNPSIDSRVGPQQLQPSDAVAAYRNLWPNQNTSAEISCCDFIEVYSDISRVVAHDNHFEQLLAESWVK
ncbi:ef hand protein [Plasmopara halstedii]|uniref:Ef hand protein n=1 Tax=Plasmopara halstedii TaxID=4781 RepID=A0A0N7L713_PLAHL|nr:ef hand protein [Plasmopara halstedii]CEG45795.1 ef hand protein [Plasmopara halstedii]|eukprot:XP_024582164.1 ef hand protein [Plasmopara halstedii]